MEQKHNYTTKELLDYTISKNTIDSKNLLAEKGIEFLIEGLDQERIEDLKSAGQFKKENRRGQLKKNNSSGIGIAAPFEVAEYNGYLALEREVLQSKANVVITRTSGIPLIHQTLKNTSSHLPQEKNPFAFYIQGDMYSVHPGLIKKGE